MSKRERQKEPAAGAQPPSTRRSPESSAWLVRAAMLAGLALLVFMNWTALREARAGRAELGDRLARLDGQVTQLATKVDTVARGAAPQRGPDPNRVYTVRTESSPAKGPATAPVVIAEFSDFQ
jgi:hypothetical protein